MAHKNNAERDWLNNSGFDQLCGSPQPSSTNYSLRDSTDALLVGAIVTELDTMPLDIEALFNAK